MALPYRVPIVPVFNAVRGHRGVNWANFHVDVVMYAHTMLEKFVKHLHQGILCGLQV